MRLKCDGPFFILNGGSLGLEPRLSPHVGTVKKNLYNRNISMFPMLLNKMFLNMNMKFFASLVHSVSYTYLFHSCRGQTSLGLDCLG